MAKESEISKIEKGIAKTIKHEERVLRDEIKTEEKGAVWFLKSHSFRIILLVIIFIILDGVLIYSGMTHNQVYIEKSEIGAPVITLSPAIPGVLDKVLVKEGDSVSADMVVAQVAGVPIKAKVDGIVIFVQNTPGQLVSSQTPVVEMIQPSELRLIGHIEEDKGLSQIKPGQKVSFTVDAFGSEKFQGTVESISPTSEATGITFSISDKRAERNFDVKVIYDVNSHPEFKNGMSAKMWVST